MHEEKSRCYWYQFSDYTLVWPTNKKETARKAVFFYKWGGMRRTCEGSMFGAKEKGTRGRADFR